MNRLSEAQLVESLGWLFKAPTFITLTQVRVPPGFREAERSIADAIAIGRWAPRFDVHGFEMKSDRQDWESELKRPEKSEVIKRCCDFWWLVTGYPGLASVDELPTGWGLLEPNEFGELTLKVKAPRLAPIQSSAFIASILNKTIPEVDATGARRTSSPCVKCKRAGHYLLHGNAVCQSCRRKLAGSRMAVFE